MTLERANPRYRCTVSAIARTSASARTAAIAPRQRRARARGAGANSATSCAGRRSIARSPGASSDQPWFLNAVVLLETDWRRARCSARLQAIEERLGRVRGERWGPRTIDLDLLLYDDARYRRARRCAFRTRVCASAPSCWFRWPRSTIASQTLRDCVAGRRTSRGSCESRRESDKPMPEERISSVSERVRALARFLADSGAVRVRITRGDEDIEIAVRSRHAAQEPEAADARRPERAARRVDTIKADLVGIFHLSRPAPVEGDVLDGDRELGLRRSARHSHAGSQHGRRASRRDAGRRRRAGRIRPAALLASREGRTLQSFERS